MWPYGSFRKCESFQCSWNSGQHFAQLIPNWQLNITLLSEVMSGPDILFRSLYFELRPPIRLFNTFSSLIGRRSSSFDLKEKQRVFIVGIPNNGFWTLSMRVKELNVNWNTWMAFYFLYDELMKGGLRNRRKKELEHIRGWTNTRAAEWQTPDLQMPGMRKPAPPPAGTKRSRRPLLAPHESGGRRPAAAGPGEEESEGQMTEEEEGSSAKYWIANNNCDPK